MGKENKENKKEFAYLEQLTNNAPNCFEEYNAEASILKSQIDDENVKNIAVVAKYGAGKSSAINTYLHNYRRTKLEKWKKKTLGDPKKNKYTRITLSTFNETNYDEVAIERSLLQQLLYSRKKQDLPNSEIKRTNKTSVFRSVVWAVLLLLWSIAWTLFALEMKKVRLFDLGISWIKYVELGCALLLTFVFIFHIIHCQWFSRIKYKDFEIDLQEKKDGNNTEHLINKFVDEVIYFFDCIDLDLVIFEDLDRLPSPDVFAKLRELNIIINGSRKKYGKVTFLYAVKDDLFKTEEERAKFFDFILPIVPVINPITTAEILGKRLQDIIDHDSKNKKLGLAEKFIKRISAYIPDMRILKNTLNDYLIMYSKIFVDTDMKVEFFSPEKLFAIALYKNLFAYDYSLLERGCGLIPMVIDLEKLREADIKEIDKKIEVEEEWLKKLNKEQMQSIEELKTLFIGQMVATGKVVYSPYGNNKRNISEKDFSFIGLADGTEIVIPNAYARNQNGVVLFSKGYNSPNGQTYYDRENIILENNKNKGDDTRKRIEYLKQERLGVANSSLANIIKNCGIEACFADDLAEQYCEKYKQDLDVSENTFVENQVQRQIRYLRFLVANEYIDERYIEYTSNYKSQRITRGDLQFIQDIQAQIQSFDYCPANINEVIKRLEDEDFSCSSICNKAIFDNLGLIRDLDKTEKTKKYLKIVELLGMSMDDACVEAIEKYISLTDGDNLEEFLKAIIPHRSSLFVDMMKDELLTNEKQEFLVVCIIKYAADYVACNKDGKLSKYLSGHKHFVHLLEQAGEEKSIKMLNALHPLFRYLSRCGFSQAVQDLIIKKNMYDFTLDNMAVVFDVDQDNLASDFYNRHIGFIKEKNNETALAYIKGNLNNYLRMLLSDERISFQNESQEDMKELLLDTTIDLEVKESLVSRINAEFSDITEFNSELFPVLLKEKKVTPIWRNAISAYDAIGYEGSIEEYVLNTKLTGEYIDNSTSKDKGFELYLKLLINAPNEKLREILQTIKVSYLLSQIVKKYYKDGNNTEHSCSPRFDQNLTTSIESGNIEYRTDDLQYIKSFPNSCIAYINKFDFYINSEVGDFFKEILPQMQHVVVGGRSSTKYQAGKFTLSILGRLVGSKVAIDIKKWLIDKCLQVIEINGFERNYANYYIQNNLAVPSAILWQFAQATNVSKQDKISMLNLSADVIDQTKELKELKEYLKSLGDSWASVVESGKKVKINVSSGEEKLLLALRKKDLLTYRKTGPQIGAVEKAYSVTWAA